MATAYHMVHYRLFKSAGTGSVTFEGLCRLALDTKNNAGNSGVALWQRVNDRVFDVPAEGRKIVLNRVADLASAVFGEMCLIQSDGFQALLELTANSVQTSNLTTAEIFNLQERSAPQNSEFIRGMIYWLAIKNNLFFVKTQSMTAELLQRYFEWLLKVQSTALPASAILMLQAEFDRSQLGGDIGEIRSMKVSGIAVPLTLRDPAKAPSTSTRLLRIMEKSAEFAQAVPIVEALFGEKKTKSLVDSLGPNEYLSVDASVKVRGQRTEESREKMRALAGELADLTDGKVQVEGKDGKLSDDDAILRTRMPFNLPQEGSNFLEFENVADQLQQVYSRFVDDGKISA
jgi:hypothetical protein